MSETNPFNTPKEQLERLAEELRQTKDALREVAKGIAQIEVRVKRAFPSMPGSQPRTRNSVKPSAEPTLGPEDAMRLYDELVKLAQNNEHDRVRGRLSSLALEDLNVLRQELGVSLGKKKPSRPVLEDAITSRLRESVLLSRHTNRTEILRKDSESDEKQKSGT